MRSPLLDSQVKRAWDKGKRWNERAEGEWFLLPSTFLSMYQSPALLMTLLARTLDYLEKPACSPGPNYSKHV